MRLVGRSASAQRLPQGLRHQEQQPAGRLRRNGGGNTADSQTAMENCIQKDPTSTSSRSTSRARCAWTALKNAGKTRARRRSCPSTAAAPACGTSGAGHRRHLPAVPAADGVARRPVVSTRRRHRRPGTPTPASTSSPRRPWQAFAPERRTAWPTAGVSRPPRRVRGAALLRPGRGTF